MDIETRASLLAKPNWSAKDIEAYCEVKTSKAYEIRNKAIKEFGGSIKYLPERVTVQSVLSVVGTSISQQLEIIHSLIVDKNSV